MMQNIVHHTEIDTDDEKFCKLKEQGTIPRSYSSIESDQTL